jgi:hypothetical protein
LKLDAPELILEDVGGIVLDTLPSVYFWNNSNEEDTIITALITGEAYNFIHKEGIEKYVRQLEG